MYFQVSVKGRTEDVMPMAGSTLAGIMDSLAKSISYGLQYGVPLRAYVEAFVNQKFEPAGMTDDPDIRISSSIIDYLFPKLALLYMDPAERARLVADAGIDGSCPSRLPRVTGVESVPVGVDPEAFAGPAHRP